MSSTLKPCPFCGGSAEVQSYEAPTVPAFYWVACTQCQVDTPLNGIVTEKDARNAWNRRVGDEFNTQDGEPQGEPDGDGALRVELDWLL